MLGGPPESPWAPSACHNLFPKGTPSFTAAPRPAITIPLRTLPLIPRECAALAATLEIQPQVSNPGILGDGLWKHEERQGLRQGWLGSRRVDRHLDACFCKVSNPGIPRNGLRRARGALGVAAERCWDGGD